MKIDGKTMAGVLAGLLLLCTAAAGMPRYVPAQLTLSVSGGASEGSDAGGAGSGDSKEEKPKRTTSSTDTVGTYRKDTSRLDGISDTIQVEQARELFQERHQAAVEAGSASVTIPVRGTTRISRESLRELAALGRENGVTVRVVCDVRGSGRQARLTVNPALSTKAVALGADLDSYTATRARDNIRGEVQNTVQVIYLAQDGDFGMDVQVKAVVDLSGMDQNNLVLYAYDRSAKTYTPLENANLQVGEDGALTFTTSLAGNIVVSDGALVLR